MYFLAFLVSLFFPLLCFSQPSLISRPTLKDGNRSIIDKFQNVSARSLDSVLNSLNIDNHPSTGTWIFSTESPHILGLRSPYFALGFIEPSETETNLKTFHLVIGFRTPKHKQIQALYSTVLNSSLSELETAETYFPTPNKTPSLPYVVSSCLPTEPWARNFNLPIFFFLFIGKSGKFQFNVETPSVLSKVIIGSESINVTTRKMKISFKTHMAGPLTSLVVDTEGKLEVPVWAPHDDSKGMWNQLVVRTLLSRRSISQKQ